MQGTKRRQKLNIRMAVSIATYRYRCRFVDNDNVLVDMNEGDRLAGHRYFVPVTIHTSRTSSDRSMYGCSWIVSFGKDRHSDSFGFLQNLRLFTFFLVFFRLDIICVLVFFLDLVEFLIIVQWDLNVMKYNVIQILIINIIQRLYS